MGNYYWDSSSPNNQWGEWPSGSDTSSSNSSWYIAPVYRRRILVQTPERWKDEDTLAFVNLVNAETHTGWIAEMIIKGDVIITDPSIEIRTMEEFVPLLRWGASRQDNAKIDLFFDEHPI
jgi:hypothetical protein